MSVHERVQSLFRIVLSGSALLAVGTVAPVRAAGVTVTNHGHSALLIRGGGQSVMVNPFRAVGCAKGLAEPRVNATVILASSELPDEGARIGGGTYLAKPGSYRVGGLKIEGFATPHDRVGGRRFGQATVWRWQQAGLNFAHLGGTAATLSGEDKVLLGRPDVLIIGVGGGGKVYNGEEAAKVVRALNPRRVIPVQYVNGEPPSGCDLGDAQPFLDAMAGTEVRKVGPNLNLPGTLGDNTVIEVMR
jgi:L-ascorbate metabolism protein UlaG (beta-lactamase superfamily)